MLHSTKSVSPLRQRMIEDMTMRKLSPKTQSAYLRHVVKVGNYVGRSLYTATTSRQGSTLTPTDRH